MKSRIWAAFQLDALFQFRSGFYAIYLILSLIYIIIVNTLPTKWGAIAVPFMIFSDPSVLGFFFIGGLVMLEKGQGILDLVSVTPLSEVEYLLSKIISLNVIALLASLAIVTFTHQSFNLILLILSVLLSSSFFTMFGFLVALSSHSINQYFGKVIPLMLLIIIPVFSLIGFPFSKLFYVFPSTASAKLMIDTFFGCHLLDTVMCLLILMAWNCLIFIHVIKKFKAYVITGGADNG